MKQTNMKNHNFAVIMAGGVGSRFWPVSTQQNPKQFQDILGCGETLIQSTFRRLKRIVPFNQIYILTNAAYKETVLKQLPEIDEQQLVLEPAMRNTAPCILLAAMKIFKIDSEARMLVAPSDHWIQNMEEFQADMELAFQMAGESDKLVTFGIKPSMPSTGFGYIQYQPSSEEEIYKVDRFIEKPDFQTAVAFLLTGNYLWNSGIFVWKASVILQQFRVYLPVMYLLFSQGEEFYNTEKEQDFVNSEFEKAENISIDYGIIEKAAEVYVIPASFSWNDLGTWGSIQGELPQDTAGNTVVNSRFIARNSEGNIVRTTAEKIVFMEGLKDYMVLEDEGVLLIVPKKKEQEIKLIRQQVMQQYGTQLG
ncbi:Mannose-1-phosphate guanylyltransferase (GDP) [Christiangramia flava JLT2011]|uniref:mannose-1-phosphate guanylyltransferase n=2 Tax=Christiangramia TaxID=292691 RepID=A0A1L7I7C3_9FLAO|nr:Mannose-1-phosphate guanylyltransferase (GDP) [Christiangramia flava JLT2011]OSS38521.1 Mannose-1-phosphate guanylyltransferase (GDP) [Christiangramia flava JLT2011]